MPDSITIYFLLPGATQSIIARNVIKLRIIRVLPHYVFHAICQITMPPQTPVIPFLIFPQTVLIAILPTRDGNPLNTGNMIPNPFPFMQAGITVRGAIVLIVTQIRPAMHNSPALTVMHITNLT